MKALLPLCALLLAGCATTPPGESPIEEAQRRMATEPPVLVADGCLHRRNAFYLDHYIVDESRELGEQGAKEVIAGFKEYGPVQIKQFVVPVMCATEMPPRGDAKGGRISDSESTQDKARSLIFPEPLSPVVEKDEPLLKAYTQLFGDCDDTRYRKERRYDCPLLSAEQAALLKARLKTPYVVALSVGGERLSSANRGAGALLGLLLGAINIANDAGTARVRLVNLDTGNLVYSSYPSEFNGRTPADVDGLNGGSGSGALALTDNWVKRMVKPLFEKQR
jgi:hypothetical protein